jgi:DNA-binding GntR family transcriptional regulator
MVIIGTGPGDPRAWVQAAYAITATLEVGGPHDPLPTRPEIARELGISTESVQRAYRELSALGLVWLVPGLGYYPAPGSVSDRTVGH